MSRRENRTTAARDGRSPLRVLVLDVGGSSVKMRVSGDGAAREIASGSRMTPSRMVRAVMKACAGWTFDAVSIGYPGPVRDGRPAAEPWNLGKGWRRFDYEQAFGRPVRIVNDAAMQALGSYRGGRMLFLGLGTGLGTAMVADGTLVPMELAHLRCRGLLTFEDELGTAGLRRLGLARWRRVVADVVTSLSAAFLPDYVVVGGGNSRLLAELPRGVVRGSNDAAFGGGLALWDEQRPVRGGATRAASKAPRPPRADRVPVRGEEAACSDRAASR